MLRLLVALVGNHFGYGVEHAPILADGTIHFVVGAGLGFRFLLAHFLSLHVLSARQPLSGDASNLLSDLTPLVLTSA